MWARVFVISPCSSSSDVATLTPALLTLNMMEQRRNTTPRPGASLGTSVIDINDEEG